MDRPDFVFEFNRHRQWCKVFLWDVHPNTFANWKAGRWGYFQASYNHPAVGLFGEFHFVEKRLRIDTIKHEMDHMVHEWVWANRLGWSKHTEEKFICLSDIAFWSFLRCLSKIKPETKVWMKTLSEL